MPPVRQHCAGSVLWTLRKFGGYCSGIKACIFPGAAPHCICMPCAYALCTDAAQTCAYALCTDAAQTCAYAKRTDAAQTCTCTPYARALCAGAGNGTCAAEKGIVLKAFRRKSRGEKGSGTCIFSGG